MSGFDLLLVSDGFIGKTSPPLKNPGEGLREGPTQRTKVTFPANLLLKMFFAVARRCRIAIADFLRPRLRQQEEKHATLKAAVSSFHRRLQLRGSVASPATCLRDESQPSALPRGRVSSPRPLRAAATIN